MKDLHLHLSGATPPEVLWEIVRESGLKTGAKTYWDFAQHTKMDKVKDLDSYLKILHAIDEAQSSPLAVERSVYSAYRSAYLAGCTYLELRWNCVKRSQHGRIDLDRLIVAGRAGYERARMMYGIQGGMVLCLGRDCTEEENEALFKKAMQYHKKGVIGLDIAGPEKREMPDSFVHYYRAANAVEMITTCHVGEYNHEGVDDEIAFVLEKLKPQRIGHGIQITRFPKLMKKAAADRIHFEICITSNLVTKAVADTQEMHKILNIMGENGLESTICTDATFPLNTDIAKENELLRKILSDPPC